MKVKGKEQETDKQPEGQAPAAGCVHWWIVGPPPDQHHRCKLCGAEFDFKPARKIKAGSWPKRHPQRRKRAAPVEIIERSILDEPY